MQGLCMLWKMWGFVIFKLVLINFHIVYVIIIIRTFIGVLMSLNHALEYSYMATNLTVLKKPGKALLSRCTKITLMSIILLQNPEVIL